MGEDEALLFSRARGDGGCAGIRHSVAREEAAEEISKALCREEHNKPRHLLFTTNKHFSDTF